jgi:hypothetical protein
MKMILSGALALSATVTGMAGIAAADGGPTTNVPGQVVQQTATQTGAPSQDVIDMANNNAILLTASQLASNEHVDPNLHPNGPTTCYSVWETVYEVERFGPRIESVCFTLAVVPPQSDPTQRVVVVVTNLVETFADGTKLAWSYKVNTYDEIESAAHPVPDQNVRPQQHDHGVIMRSVVQRTTHVLIVTAEQSSRGM